VRYIRVKTNFILCKPRPFKKSEHPPHLKKLRPNTILQGDNMKRTTKEQHRETQDRYENRLKNETVNQLIQNAVDIKVTTQLDGTIQKFELKYNTGGGQAYINTGRKSIETYDTGEERTHFNLDDEAERKIEMIHQHLETQHRAMRNPR